MKRSFSDVAYNLVELFNALVIMLLLGANALFNAFPKYALSVSLQGPYQIFNYHTDFVFYFLTFFIGVTAFSAGLEKTIQHLGLSDWLEKL